MPEDVIQTPPHEKSEDLFLSQLKMLAEVVK
jgi:hypothetical protein